MSRISPVMLFLVTAVAAGCASGSPRWREDARVALISVRDSGAGSEFPAEYGSVLHAFVSGNKLLHEDEVAAADEYFRLALIESRLLERELGRLKARRDEEARLRVLAERRETERLKAIHEEEQRAAQAKEEAERERTLVKPSVKERPLPLNHTVKRGETLPQIASQPDVYNDYRLWPLLYRANRDQISDPKHIWPGQVLRIPRNLSREVISEARRYSLSKPIH